MLDKVLHCRFDYYSEVAFDIQFSFNSLNYKGIDTIQEGMELSFRTTIEGGPTEWIPLLFITKTSDTTQPPLIELLPSLYNTSTSSFTLRGYRIPYVLESETENYYNVSICGDGILEYPLQLRWLQTSYQDLDSDVIMSDVIILDNVTVSLRNGTHYATLLQDCFDDQTFIR